MDRILENIIAKNNFTIEKLKNYLTGKTVEIISNNSGHNYRIGDKIKITKEQSRLLTISNITNPTAGTIGRLTPSGNNAFFRDLKIIDKFNKEYFLEEIKNLEESKKEIDSDIENYKFKINFLEETNLKEFDENEFKAYKTLSLIEDNSLSKVEKAKLIASLIEK